MKEFGEMKEENPLPILMKDPINRVQLAQYAGASGDFNPIHIDEEFAKKSPLKGVIAHGMLSMGFISEYAEKLAGENGKINTIKAQFRSIVRIGDVITCEGILKDVDKDRKTFEIKAKNQNGDIVVKGTTEIEATN